MADHLQTTLEKFAFQARDLIYGEEITHLPKPPSAVEFLRKYVLLNKPVVIENGLNHWHAYQNWTNDYLRKAIGEKVVSVSVTPNGYADAVDKGYFVLPEERQLSVNNFLDILEGKKEKNGVFYIQKQNSNLVEEFEELMDDIEQHITFATEAFDRTPEAVNFWMGESQAVTSMHKDHYENLYCVLRGQKTFILIPPTDQLFVPYELFPVGTYCETSKGEFQVIKTEGDKMVPWIPCDAENPDLEKYPEFAKAKAFKVTVKAGEMLYLPQLWYHHVRQTHGCIAVNFWYDMDIQLNFLWYGLLEKILRPQILKYFEDEDDDEEKGALQQVE